MRAVSRAGRYDAASATRNKAPALPAKIKGSVGFTSFNMVRSSPVISHRHETRSHNRSSSGANLENHVEPLPGLGNSEYRHGAGRDGRQNRKSSSLRHSSANYSG